MQKKTVNKFRRFQSQLRGKGDSDGQYWITLHREYTRFNPNYVGRAIQTQGWYPETKQTEEVSIPTTWEGRFRHPITEFSESEKFGFNPNYVGRAIQTTKWTAIK